MTTLLKLLKWIAFTSLWVALLFGIAGRRDLPILWAYCAVNSGLALAGIFTIDPSLERERWRPGPGGVDRKTTAVLVGLCYVAHIAVACLDTGRFHWSDTVPLGLQLTALIAFAASWAEVAWAMAVNPFFSSVVRIQTERGHHLITAGPYRYVRHPGYAGAIIGILCSALALGSWWSLLPAVAMSFAVLRRAALEDAFLRDNLGGYKTYMEKVRYRLLPGIW
jgi:protein-S-isoprenylcysteine O-methyltransferase Ste14